MSYYLLNNEKNGIEIYFDNKPSNDIIAELKEARFRWYPPKNCWYNKNTPNNLMTAQKLCGNSSAVSVEKTMVSQPTSQFQKQYPQSKFRISNNLFTRDLKAEKTFGIDNITLYGYWKGEDAIYIAGQIFSQKPIRKNFCMMCTVYDKDGDIIETQESCSYGGGLVTSMIKPATFFDGFPFCFILWDISKKSLKEIKIAPAGSY